MSSYQSVRHHAYDKLTNYVSRCFLITFVFLLTTTAAAQPMEVPSSQTIGGCTISSTRGVNRRAGAGTTFEALGQFGAGQSVVGIGQANGADGFVWWQLEDGSFVRSDVVTAEGNCEDLPVVPVSSAGSSDSASVTDTAEQSRWNPIVTSNISGMTDIFLGHGQLGAHSTDLQYMAIYDVAAHEIAIWDSTGPTEVATLSTSGMVMSMEFSPDDQLIAVSDNSLTVTVWEIGSGIMKSQWRVTSVPSSSVYDIPALYWSPDSTLLLVSYSDSAHRDVWDVNTGSLKLNIESAASVPQNLIGDVLQWSQNSRFLYIYTDTANLNQDANPIELWDMLDNRLKDRYVSLVFSPDGHLIASKDSADSPLQIWDTQSGETVSTYHAPQPVWPIMFSTDSGKLAISDTSRTVQILDFYNDSVQNMESNFNWPFYMIEAFLPDKLIVSYFSQFIIYDPTTGRPIPTPTDNSQFNSNLTFSHDYKYVAYAPDGSSLKIYDLNSGNVKTTIRLAKANPRPQFSPDNTLLMLQYSADNAIQFWDTNTGRLKVTIYLPSDNVHSAFTHDGKFLTYAPASLQARGSLLKTDFIMQLWAVPARGVQIDRTGVILTDGYDSFIGGHFDIPNEWLPTGGLPPQYEIRVEVIVVQVGECVYVPVNGSGGVHDIKFIRRDLKVTIVNRANGQIANQRTFNGEVNEPICPYRDPGDGEVSVLDPEPAVEWIPGAMAGLGFD